MNGATAPVTITITHDATPPSANTNAGVGGRGSARSVGRTKLEWEGTFGFLLMKAKVPRGLRWVRVKPRLQFRTNQGRDGDNFYMPISKPLGDILQKGGWLPNDTPEFYNCERVRIETGVTDLPQHVKGRTILEIEYEL